MVGLRRQKQTPVQNEVRLTHEPYIKNLTKKFRLQWHDQDDLRQELRIKVWIAERKYKRKPVAERTLLIRAACRNRANDFFQERKRIWNREQELTWMHDRRAVNLSIPLEIHFLNLPAQLKQLAEQLSQGCSIQSTVKKLKISLRTAYRYKLEIGREIL